LQEIDDGNEVHEADREWVGSADVKRVFVYEYLSGGGLVEADAATRAALLPSGIAMRDAMVADLLRLPDCAVTVAADPGVAAPPGRVGTAAPHPGEGAQDFVARASTGHDHVWLVAPETDGLLARLQRRVGDARSLGCTADAIALCTSKSATAMRLAAHAVWTPRAFEHDPHTRRWVTKPDDGAGAVSTVRHVDRAAARADFVRRSCAGESVVLEPWVEGDPMSLSLLCDDGRIELLSVNRQRIGVDTAGRVDYEGVELDVLPSSDPRHGRLERLARQVAGALPGLRGFVGIDLVWSEAVGPVVIEVNPRVTCAYVGLSAALGRNLAAAVVAMRATAEHADVAR
jgi:predicted ATP-grasp superfamily ATP-dependent carboligase